MKKLFQLMLVLWSGGCSLLQAQSVTSLNTWTYVHGREDETLYGFVFPDFTFGETVVLPHRLIKPNSVFWYHARVNLPGKGFLKIKADDGAQVWVGGQRCYLDKSGFFPFSGMYGETDVVIRVLNNAVAGGLGKAACISATNSEPLQNLQIADSFSFTFWGDSQGGWDTFSKIFRVIQSFHDPLTIGLGDLTANGSDLNQWVSLGKILHPEGSSIRCLTVPGNHDYDDYYDDLEPGLYKTFYTREGKRTFFFEKADNAAFLGLDINRNFPLGIDSEQRKFIDSACTTPAWKEADWRFVLIHQPPYAQGWKGYSGEDAVRVWLESEAKKYRIDVVLSGHVHDYERISKNFDGQKTTCIVSGGAGGHIEPRESNDTPIMDKLIKKHHFGRIKVTKKILQCEIYDTNGQVIDFFEILK